MLTDELRSGAAVATAWQAAARVVRELLPAAAAARSGADVPAALLAVRARTGFGLRSVAAAWAVADRTGVPPADLVERVVDRMRDDEAVHREVEAQLAGPRVTARLLVGLPGFGLLIGSMLGYRPLRFLFGSPYGVACLVTGVAATAFGAWWIGRLAAGARVGSDL